MGLIVSADIHLDRKQRYLRSVTGVLPGTSEYDARVKCGTEFLGLRSKVSELINLTTFGNFGLDLVFLIRMFLHGLLKFIIKHKYSDF